MVVDIDTSMQKKKKNSENLFMVILGKQRNKNGHGYINRAKLECLIEMAMQSNTKNISTLCFYGEPFYCFIA